MLTEESTVFYGFTLYKVIVLIIKIFPHPKELFCCYLVQYKIKYDVYFKLDF